MLNHQKYEQLRQKLVNAEPLNEGEVTGHSVSEMLKEIEEVSNIGNPYCLPSTQVQQYMDQHRQQVAHITTNIRKMWTEMEFLNTTVSVSDAAAITQSATTVSFVGCRSKEWTEIGKRLAALPRVISLTVNKCDSADDLCADIRGSKLLQNIRMGK
jgi:hypothetical protein